MTLGPPPAPPAPVELDADQQRVLAHPGGPLLVLGAAGSGRTTTMIETAVARIRAGAPADSVLVLTFSRRSANEVRNRIATRLGEVAVPPPVMTVHGLSHSLVRRFTDPEDPRELRLLTAPEQEFRLREVLAGMRPEVARWPEELTAAVGTRGFAAELRAVFARARQLAMDPEDLIEAGRRAERPEWVTAGEFFAEYLDVLDGEGVLDYDELVHRTRLLLADPVIGEQVRAEIGCVLIDDLHDLDPAQIALLRSLSKPGASRLAGAEVIAFADPDQSVYAFRGANARAALDFPDTFTDVHGQPAPVVVLGTNHRQAERLVSVQRLTGSRIPLPRPLPQEIVAGWRNPAIGRSGVNGKVEVLTFDSPGAEADHIADLLRHAHLQEGLGWSQMAVLVRNGRAALPGLARALVAAGVPVEIAGDEIPLAQEPAVQPLLLGLTVAAGQGGPDPDQARRLLTSPLGGLDAMGVRRLGRMLREAERIELAGARLPRPSDELLAECLVDTTLLQSCPDGQDRRRALALAALLGKARERIAAGAGAEEVLWLLWNGTAWPKRLAEAALRRDDPARAADRDLDAVVALFDLARRSQERSGDRGVANFEEEVAGQQIPADTQREGDLRGGAVRLLTAHRAKGWQWPLVVVAGVQEGVWPNLRRRGTLLEADRLSPEGLGPGTDPVSLLSEERRLFHLACSRAEDRLVVTAVTGTEGEGDQPSRFLTDLRTGPEHRGGRPRRPLNLTGMVGELRRAVLDPGLSPGLRSAAAARLATLTDHVPAADPSRWWGMAPRTEADDPITAPDAEVRLSGSALEMLLSCPRRWFLARKARGDKPVGSAATIGSVVHAVLDEAAHSDLALDDLAGLIERVWQQIPMQAIWFGRAELERIHEALERYVNWHPSRGREVVGTEVAFDVVVPVSDDRVRLTGSIDRIERDGDGNLYVIDFKTGKKAPKKEAMLEHSQLGVYQLALLSGAAADLVGPDPVLAGAELVYLRDAKGRRDPLSPKVMWQASITEVPWPNEHSAETATEQTWIHQQLTEAARRLRSEEFPAIRNGACRICAFLADCPAQSTRTAVVK
ncbi:ATP-dependent helicase [Enemella sp. A6]|uniref:ATP-dependent helicase n=1 Tax=Enemella sp. A6 TaxID=3440152 RepID=UPI003EB7BFD7